MSHLVTRSTDLDNVYSLNIFKLTHLTKVKYYVQEKIMCFRINNLPGSILAPPPQGIFFSVGGVS